MNIKKIHYYTLSLLFVSLLLAIYWSTLKAKVLLDQDYSLVVEPFLKINHFADYSQALKSFKILDIQPLRDLSIFLALKVEKILGIQNIFVKYNFILWLASCLLIWKIFKRIALKKTSAIIAIFFLGVHPVFAKTIPWQSAHKHVLAFIFALLAINLFLKIIKEKDLSVVYYISLFFIYLLSILSQPIAIALPLWFLLYLTMNTQYSEWNKGLKYLLVSLVILMLTFSILNYYYYSEIYTQATHTAKFASGGISDGLLSLGRYFIQLIFPVSFALYYYQGSDLNLVGLLTLPLFLYLLKTQIGFQKTVTWGSLFLFPLVMVNLRPTNIFVSDSYLLLPSIGFSILLVFFIEAIWKKIGQQKIRSLIILLGSFFFLGLFFQARHQAKLWTDPFALIEESYKKENSCVNLLSYSTNLWRFPERQEEAISKTRELLLRNCQVRMPQSLFSDMSQNALLAGVYFSKDLTLDEKIQFETFLGKKNPYAHMFLTALFLKKQDNEKALKTLRYLLKETGIQITSFDRDPAYIEITEHCKLNPSPSCDSILKILKESNYAPNL